MKTRTVPAEYLLEIWEGVVTTTIFPKSLFNRLRPLDILDSWGDELPAMREKMRPQVDRFIERVLDFDTTEEHWRALQEIDPEIMALFCDRLNATTFALKCYANENDTVQIPASWSVLVRLLLTQKLLQ